MDWQEDGIILGVRKHGEANAILELLTAERGRHLGLVRGGRSRRMQAALQPGNSVNAVWRARLEDHLGTYTVEPLVQRAAGLMTMAASLHALNTLTAHCLLLAEREPHPRLFQTLDAILSALGEEPQAGVAVVRFELAFLDDLGFGLDLHRCAATGVSDHLVYVSPKSGRAVCREAGAPYRDRLLPLPSFLTDGAGSAATNPEKVRQGFALTGYFLDRHVYGPRGVTMPASRQQLLQALVSG